MARVRHRPLRFAVRVALLLCTLLPACRPGPQAPGPRPTSAPVNLLLITSDTTRADDLGCYGGPAHTPAINRLASEGIVFESAFANALCTGPSHATLLTSTYAVEHQIYSNDVVLAEHTTTLAEVLSARGLTTAGIVSGPPLRKALGFSRGFAAFDDRLATTTVEPRNWYSRYERRASDTAERFLRWLPQDGRAFFGWVHFYDPHQPYDPPNLASTAQTISAPQFEQRAELRALFGGGEEDPRYVKAESLAALPAPFQIEVDAAARVRYRGEIAEVDRAVGRILDRLRASGQYDQTLIVFLADHGENFLDRGSELAFAHHRLYADVARVPLIVKLPGPRPEGRREQFLLGTIDIAPTLLEFMGIDVPPAWRGRSFAATLAGSRHADRDEFRRFVVLEQAYEPAWPEHPVGIRTPHWSFQVELATDGEPLPRHRTWRPVPDTGRLYSLRDDPGERHDRYHPDDPRVQAFRRLLLRHFAGAPSAAPPKRLDSAEEQEALRALGYLR